MAALLLAAACARGRDGQATVAESAAPASGVTYAYERRPLDTTRAPGTIVDSVFPMPEMLRRFRSGLPETRALTGGAGSPEALVRRFIAALSARDRTALGQLALSRAEFAWLYFPATPDAEQDTGMPPTLRWDAVTRNSETGITRALTRVGGQALTLQSLDCPAPARAVGTMRLHEGCTLRLSLADGGRFTGRLFGTIVEIDGRFKFVGYSNDM